MPTTTAIMNALMADNQAPLRLGIPRSTWRSYRTRYHQGKLTYDKIYELIELAGYTLKQEREWDRHTTGQYPEPETHLNTVD